MFGFHGLGSGSCWIFAGDDFQKMNLRSVLGSGVGCWMGLFVFVWIWVHQYLLYNVICLCLDLVYPRLFRFSFSGCFRRLFLSVFLIWIMVLDAYLFLFSLDVYRWYQFQFGLILWLSLFEFGVFNLSKNLVPLQVDLNDYPVILPVEWEARRILLLGIGPTVIDA